ncbi:MAG: DUF4070 domain-containing protein, partial [Symploca sp. SIO2B6]|nr:DUF4070 domain-containing protein [Symploca sp. SIO2B6]
SATRATPKSQPQLKNFLSKSSQRANPLAVILSLLNLSLQHSQHQTTLVNFLPTRPIEDIAREYVRCFWELYDPSRYLARVYRHFVDMQPKPHRKAFTPPELVDIRALLIICWRQGLKRKTRFQFWQQLISMAQRNPKRLKSYLVNCAHIEHFIEYRQIVRDEINEQLNNLAPIVRSTPPYQKEQVIPPRSA